MKTQTSKQVKQMKHSKQMKQANAINWINQQVSTQIHHRHEQYRNPILFL